MSDPERTCASIATAIFVLWSATLVLISLRPHFIRWPPRLHPFDRWPLRLYLDSRYGKPVPLATAQRIVDGKSIWSWVCPHCGTPNDGDEPCGGCGAVFDGGRFRVKKAL